jgi:hypothetical protein
MASVIGRSLYIAVKKHQPHLQTTGCQGLGRFSAWRYEGPIVALPGPLVKLSLISLFSSYPFTVHALCGVIIGAIFLLLPIYSSAR